MKPWLPIAAVGLALSPLAVVHPLRVRGRSMEPTLRDGELCLVLRAWASGAPVRGEVWWVSSPEGSAVKRVAGLPGERLELREGDLLAEGRRVEPPPQARLERQDGSWVCGDGYFLLGDNRPESRDSRAWGAVAPSAMKGRVLGR
ncbi:MAG: signal peptidase I [Acidobacteria bacterium]|nr:signal peptidase I [Acidobacteriota bacterium]